MRVVEQDDIEEGLRESALFQHTVYDVIEALSILVEELAELLIAKGVISTDDVRATLQEALRHESHRRRDDLVRFTLEQALHDVDHYSQTGHPESLGRRLAGRRSGYPRPSE